MMTIQKTYFVTGTDTEIGKTFSTVALLKKISGLGFRTLGLKPVASGSEHTSQGLRNHDAIQLQQSSSIQIPYHDINPFVFEAPISPHIAAFQKNKTLSVKALVEHTKKIQAQYEYDYGFIEGIGGFKVPLNNQETVAEWIIALDIPVILIIGMKLGCLNHSLLTWEAMQRASIPLKGWIANCIDPHMLAFEENMATLKAWIKAPYLGKIPYHYRSHTLQDEINIDLLL